MDAVTDNPVHLRNELVDRLVREGVLTDARVETAFRAVPRHRFLPDEPVERAYRDDAIVTRFQDGTPVSSSSQPSIMAIMLQQLDPRPGDRVLEIGAGTGYNAALLAHLVGDSGRVVTVDIDEETVAGARAGLRATGYERVEVVRGDGALGHPDAAPYDRVILTVGADDLLPAWRDQLTPDGRIVLPLGLGAFQVAVAVERRGDAWASLSVSPCGFMRLRGAFATPERVVLLPAVRARFVVATDDLPHSEGVTSLLTSPATDGNSAGVALAPADGLALIGWLSLRDPAFCSLWMGPSSAPAGGPPVAFSSPGWGAMTLGLSSKDGLALLDRDGAGTLVVRDYGRSGDLAARLRQRLQEWDAAGRPDGRRMWIRAYPRDGSAAPAPEEMVVERNFTRFGVQWL